MEEAKALHASAIRPERSRMADVAANAALNELEASHLHSHAMQLYARNQSDVALNLLSILVTLRPAQPRYLKSLAAIQRKVGNFEQAIVTYRLLDVLDPFQPEYSIAMAECFLQLKSTSLAEDILNEVIDFCERMDRYHVSLNRARALRNILRSANGAIAGP